MAERSRDWIAQAERDLEQARWSAKGGFHEWACFASQQSAEKAVKALYQRLGGETRGHSVAALLRGLAERMSIDEELLACGRALDRFYVPARYPNGWPEGAPKQYFSAEDAERAIGCGDEILRFCHGKLAESG